MIANKEKLKVLMPVLHYKPVIGGFEIFIQNLAERLSKEMTIRVITGRVRGTSEREKLNSLEIIRTSFFELKDLSYSSKWYIITTLVYLFFKSRQVIKKEEINLMHCHGFFSGLAGWLLKKVTKVPYIITIQSADLDVYHPKMPKWLISIIHWLERRVYSNALRCHSVSHDLKNYYAKQGVKNSLVIPNGVDQELFKSAAKENDKKTIVSISRLEKKNGTEDLIKALKYLNFDNYQLLIIGDGTEKNYLEGLVKELSLDDKVKFLGDMVNTEIPKYLQRADLFVRVPLAEGFGIVYIEAMACGVPVIGTPVGGITDIIKDGETGLFCQVNNPSDLAVKINLVFSNEQVRKTLIDNGLKLVQEKYNWGRITEQIKNMYEQPRVVIATGIYPPDIGGPATYSASLFKELTEQGFDVKLITYSDEVKKGDEVVRINRKKNIFFRYYSYYRQLKKLAKDSDLIYAQCALSSGLPTYWVSKKTKKPYIIKITGDYAWEQAQYQFGIKDSIDEFQGREYNRKIERMRRLKKKVVSNAQQVIVPGKYLKKIVQGWGIDESKIKVIYNSFSPLSPTSKKIEIDGDVILYFGRLTPWKGLMTLIEILPDLLKSNPNFKLMIVGEGDEREKLEKRVKELGLADKVVFTGKVDHQDLLAYYWRAKMFVLNTAYEGLPHTVLEAMAAGLPVVASNVCGTPEVIDNNVNGLLVKYNNKEELKEAILKLHNNSELARKLINNGYEKLKEFGFEKMISQTINVLGSQEIKEEEEEESEEVQEKVIALLQINHSEDHSEVTLPLGTLSVGSALDKAGFKIKLFNITEKQIDQTVEEIIELSPLYLGLSVMTGVQTRYSAELCQKLKEKKPGIKIVWGGIHPSLLPEQCLSEDYIDYVVIGEGEVTAVEFTKALNQDQTDFNNILGLGWKRNGQIIINPERPFIINLDEHRLNFDLVDLNKYLFKLRGADKTIAYKTSRGCPFNCAFCYNRAFNKNRYRYWSIEKVIEDIDYLKKDYGVNAVKFYDDNFFIDKNRAFELLEKIDLPSHIEIRIDMITDEVAKRLKELKVSELLIGIESGSNRMLDLINKGYTVDTIKEGVRILAKHDLYVTYSTIVGLPTETKEEFDKTIDLMEWIHQTHSRAGFTMGAYLPYPGSLMYQFAIDHGFQPPVKTIDWGNIDRFRKDFSSPWVDNKKVWRIREYFKFFSYNLNIINKWSEFRIKRRFFSWPMDIYLIESLAGIAIEEKGAMGKFLRKAHNSIKKFK